MCLEEIVKALTKIMRQFTPQVALTRHHIFAYTKCYEDTFWLKFSKRERLNDNMKIFNGKPVRLLITGNTKTRKEYVAS